MKLHQMPMDRQIAIQYLHVCHRKVHGTLMGLITATQYSSWQKLQHCLSGRNQVAEA